MLCRAAKRSKSHLQNPSQDAPTFQLIFRVNFSLHSSFTELDEFMAAVRPREVRCIIGNSSSTLSKTMHNRDANTSMGGDAGFLSHFSKHLDPSKKVWIMQPPVFLYIILHFSAVRACRPVERGVYLLNAWEGHNYYAPCGAWKLNSSGRSFT